MVILVIDHDAMIKTQDGESRRDPEFDPPRLERFDRDELVHTLDRPRDGGYHLVVLHIRSMSPERHQRLRTQTTHTLELRRLEIRKPILSATR